MTKILFLLFIPVFSFCQTKESDLSKYSYLLVGLKTIKDSVKTIYPIGTCFFARRDNDLFLITAKHCLNGYNGFTLQKTDSQFDTVGFRYYNNITKKTSFSSLNIKDLKKYLTNEYFFNNADVVVLKMTDTLVERFVYSLEKFFQPVQIIDQVIAFGYGLKDPKSFSSKTQGMVYKGIMADTNHTDKLYPVNDDLFYRSQPKAIQGMSGSPVFLKCHVINNKKQYIVFGGLLFGTNNTYDSAYIVSPELIKKQISNFR